MKKYKTIESYERDFGRFDWKYISSLYGGYINKYQARKWRDNNAPECSDIAGIIRNIRRGY